MSGAEFVQHGELPKGKRVYADIRKLITIEHAVTAAVFFFMSLSQWMQRPAAFCAACMLALSTRKQNTVSAFVGILIGHVYLYLCGQQVHWWTVIAALSILFMQDVKWKNDMRQGVCCFLMLLPGELIAGIKWQHTIEEYLLGLMMVTVCAVITPALNKAAAWIYDVDKRPDTADDMICVIFPVLMLLMGMGKTGIGMVNFGYAAGAFVILLLSQVLSVAASVCMGFLCALALLLGGHGIYWLSAMPLMGLFAAMVQRKRKWVSLGACMAVSVMCGYLLSGEMQWMPLVCTGLGGMAWMLLPKRIERTIALWVNRTSLTKKTDNPYLENKMLHLTKQLQRLSLAMPKAKCAMIDPDTAADTMAESMCAGCDRMMICWRDQYALRRAQFKACAEELMENGCVETGIKGCVREGALMTEAEKIIAAQQEKIRRMTESRYQQEMMNAHFSAVGRVIATCIESGIRPADEEIYQEKQINELLEMMRFPARVNYVKSENGHMVLSLKKSNFARYTENAGTLEKHISRRLGCQMTLEKETQAELIFVQAPAYCLIRGVASACAVSPERKNLSPYAVENGDAVENAVIRPGVEMTALSDGMGHGKGAGAESQKTLELLKLCLETGYTRQEALSCVNGMMLVGTAGEKFATVDLCMMDLWTGETTIEKLGANQSFVVQGQHILMVEGEALPLGIIEQVRPMEKTLRLGEGDMVVLISDGVSDAFDDAEAVGTLIRRYIDKTPQQMADGILQDALIQSGGLPEDDMTVVCIRMENRKRMAFRT